jgi:hypothetical protein
MKSNNNSHVSKPVLSIRNSLKKLFTLVILVTCVPVFVQARLTRLAPGDPRLFLASGRYAELYRNLEAMKDVVDARRLSVTSAFDLFIEPINGQLSAIVQTLALAPAGQDTHDERALVDYLQTFRDELVRDCGAARVMNWRTREHRVYKMLETWVGPSPLCAGHSLMQPSPGRGGREASRAKRPRVIRRRSHHSVAHHRESGDVSSDEDSADEEESHARRVRGPLSGHSLNLPMRLTGGMPQTGFREEVSRGALSTDDSSDSSDEGEKSPVHKRARRSSAHAEESASGAPEDEESMDDGGIDMGGGDDVDYSEMLPARESGGSSVLGGEIPMDLGKEGPVVSGGPVAPVDHHEPGPDVPVRPLGGEERPHDPGVPGVPVLPMAHVDPVDHHAPGPDVPVRPLGGEEPPHDPGVPGVPVFPPVLPMAHVDPVDHHEHGPDEAAGGVHREEHGGEREKIVEAPRRGWLQSGWLSIGLAFHELKVHPWRCAWRATQLAVEATALYCTGGLAYIGYVAGVRVLNEMLRFAVQQLRAHHMIESKQWDIVFNLVQAGVSVASNMAIFGASAFTMGLSVTQLVLSTLLEIFPEHSSFHRPLVVMSEGIGVLVTGMQAWSVLSHAEFAANVRRSLDDLYINFRASSRVPTCHCGETPMPNGQCVTSLFGGRTVCQPSCVEEPWVMELCAKKAPPPPSPCHCDPCKKCDECEDCNPFRSDLRTCRHDLEEEQRLHGTCTHDLEERTRERDEFSRDLTAEREARPGTRHAGTKHDLEEEQKSHGTCTHNLEERTGERDGFLRDLTAEREARPGTRHAGTKHDLEEEQRLHGTCSHDLDVRTGERDGFSSDLTAEREAHGVTRGELKQAREQAQPSIFDQISQGIMGRFRSTTGVGTPDPSAEKPQVGLDGGPSEGKKH